ncbi:MAG: sulfatase-like hydrolase/transferase [Opitutae bacterium]|nr:sulfatase-like hydrolase/transferase [Opitutae bacterium]
MKSLLVSLALASAVDAMAAAPSAPAASSAPARPNFLIILSDDQGYDDLSSHGNRFAETPRLDRLAAQSREFTQFYVEPACAPTRASLLTGRSFVRTGVWSVHFGGDYLPLEETTFAERLRDAGYATACIGKWHNGKIPGYLPGDRGFQTVTIADLYIHQNNGFHISNAPKVLADVAPYADRTRSGDTADRLADDAIAFLRENKDRPFCLYLPHIAVHSPWEAPPELIEKYRKKGCSERLAALYALLEQMDHAIGRVLDELDTLQLAQNTVVLFFSDNGAVHTTVGTHAGRLTPADIAVRNVSQLRGAKASIFEGGIRSPLMVRWPGKISPRKTDVIAHVTDVFPTLIDLAGAPPPPTGAKRLDGISLKPLLLDAGTLPERTLFGSELNIPAPTRMKSAPGQTKASPVREGLDLEADRAAANYGNAHLYARTQRFKLVKRGAKRELFDMAADPAEKTDVSVQFPAEAAALGASLKHWYEDILAHDRPYQAPLHLIGRPGAPGAVMHFNCARQLTGDFVGNGEWAHSLQASKSGSTATFAVRVVTPGRYRVVLEATVKANGFRGALTCGDRTTSAVLAPGEVHELGTIDVPANASEAVFTLEQNGHADTAGVEFWNIVLLTASSSKS